MEDVSKAPPPPPQQTAFRVNDEPSNGADSNIATEQLGSMHSNEDTASSGRHRSVPTSLAPATQAIHADDMLNNTTDVAPPMHVATTFRYDRNPDMLIPGDEINGEDGDDSANPAPHIYSRLTAPSTTRLETILSTLLHGPCLTYSSGLSAFHALLVHLRPNVVAIGDGYHGCHGVLHVYQKLTHCTIVDLNDISTWTSSTSTLGTGDLVHLETPLNPDGTASDISHYAQLAHSRGALLSVDATFAPPPLLDPFEWGADYVMHSGTKYLGGHSDMLCGVLGVNPSPEGHWKALTPSVFSSSMPESDTSNPTSTSKGSDEAIVPRTATDAATALAELRSERVFLGSVMGSFEGWLGIRSVRTLELRVLRQSRTATNLVRRIHHAMTRSPTSTWTSTSSISPSTGADTDAGADADTLLLRRCVSHVRHASLQVLSPDNAWLTEQMPNGFGPVFGLYMATPVLARRLPSELELFHHATSLGGVESLIEWRRMSDVKVDQRLLRVSVGVEDEEDLWVDLLGGMRRLVEQGFA